MKLQILGTAAAERWPGLWCECEYCANARKNGEIRRTAAYLVDEDTLVDFGPDIHWQVTDFKVDLTRIKRVILTHAHPDHLSPTELYWRHVGFSVVKHSIEVYGPAAVMDSIASRAAGMGSIDFQKDLMINAHILWHGEAIAADDLEILPMDANHAPGTNPLIYLITRNGRTLFISNDTGIYPQQTWEALQGRKIDLAVLDSTMGFNGADSRNGHLGVNTVLETRDRLAKMGCLSASSRCIASHFSHNGGGSQAEYEKFYNPHGIEVAYDGMTVEV